jgi:hypothetical protein
MPFQGVSVSFYGAEISGNATTGTWTIDNNLPNTFSLGRTNDPTMYNKKYFETPRYSMGSHRLVVTHNGNTSTTPMLLDYLIVQNGTLPRSTSPTSSTNKGAVIGGALAGAACLLVVIIVFFYRYRRDYDPKEWVVMIGPM